MPIIKFPTSIFGLKYIPSFGDDADSSDSPSKNIRPPKEFSDSNRELLLSEFLKVRDNTLSILEIGVCRNQSDSSTHVFIDNKLPEAFYLGVDIYDKSFLNDESNNVFTLQCSSLDGNFVIGEIERLTKSVLGTVYCPESKCYCKHQIDFLFIDGWHSIDNVVFEWNNYATLVPVGGVIGFHDTNYHPGPSAVFDAIDENYFEKEKFCADDWGIGFARRIK